VPVMTTLKTLQFDAAAHEVALGAAFVDLRPVRAYLAEHIPGSIALLYEDGPGMPSRARDCLPLEVPLILEDAPQLDLANAAAALRGKGFAVLGKVADALNAWRSSGRSLATTNVLASAPSSDVVLDVGDPGASPPPDALRVPVEALWSRLDEFRGVGRVVVAAGFGVRAALAVGLLERAGVGTVELWRTSSA
jgi:rhodanese-related sulfurtransferase